MVHEYRDRTYIRKDIMILLLKYGELNKTKLLSYAGLNMVKHIEILEEMQQKNLLEKIESPWGAKTTISYKITSKGIDFCKLILEPYEKMFPRIKKDELVNSDNFKATNKDIQS